MFPKAAARYKADWGARREGRDERAAIGRALAGERQDLAALTSPPRLSHSAWKPPAPPPGRARAAARRHPGPCPSAPTRGPELPLRGRCSGASHHVCGTHRNERRT